MTEHLQPRSVAELERLQARAPRRGDGVAELGRVVEPDTFQAEVGEAGPRENAPPASASVGGMARLPSNPRQIEIEVARSKQGSSMTASSSSQWTASSSSSPHAHGFLFRPKSPDISDISFLSVGADKKISIFFVQILFKFI